MCVSVCVQPRGFIQHDRDFLPLAFLASLRPSHHRSASERVKLSLCSITHHALVAYGGKESLAPRI